MFNNSLSIHKKKIERLHKKINSDYVRGAFFLLTYWNYLFKKLLTKKFYRSFAPSSPNFSSFLSFSAASNSSS
jgi:hypothetical protein